VKNKKCKLILQFLLQDANKQDNKHGEGMVRLIHIQAESMPGERGIHVQSSLNETQEVQQNDRIDSRIRLEESKFWDDWLFIVQRHQ
jgi:hypothetical protein